MGTIENKTKATVHSKDGKNDDPARKEVREELDLVGGEPMPSTNITISHETKA